MLDFLFKIVSLLAVFGAVFLATQAVLDWSFSRTTVPGGYTPSRPISRASN